MKRTMFIGPSVRGMRARIKDVTRRKAGSAKNRPQTGDWCAVLEPFNNKTETYLYEADSPAGMRPPDGKWINARFMESERPRFMVQVIDARLETVDEITELDAVREGMGVAGLRALWIGWPQAIGMPIDEWDTLSPRDRYLRAWTVMHGDDRQCRRFELATGGVRQYRNRRYAGWTRAGGCTPVQALAVMERSREMARALGGCSWLARDKRVPIYVRNYLDDHGLDAETWMARGDRVLADERYTPETYRVLAAS